MNDRFPTPDENCYTILGVARGASTDAVQLAYRRLSRAWHPDVNPDINPADCSEAMAAIKAARDILVDDAQRHWHDRLLDRAADGGHSLDTGVRAQIEMNFSRWRQYGAGVRGAIPAQVFLDGIERRWKAARRLRARLEHSVDRVSRARLANCESQARRNRQSVGTATQPLAALLLLIVLLGAQAALYSLPLTRAWGIPVLGSAVLSGLFAPSLIVILARFGVPRRWLIQRISCDPQDAPGILLLERAGAVLAAPATTVVLRSRRSGMPFFRYLRIGAADGEILARVLLPSWSAGKVGAWIQRAETLGQERPHQALWASVVNCEAAFGLDLIRARSRHPVLGRMRQGMVIAILAVWMAFPNAGMRASDIHHDPVTRLVARASAGWSGAEALGMRWLQRIPATHPSSAYGETVARLDARLLHLLPVSSARALAGPVADMAASKWPQR